jgi:hypothetical protein
MKSSRIYTPFWTLLHWMFGCGLFVKFQWSTDGLWWMRDGDGHRVHSWLSFGHIVHTTPTVPRAYFVTLWKLNILFALAV